MKKNILPIGGASVLASLLLFCITTQAQINTGSNGSDGPLDFTTQPIGNVVIDMHDHPNGIYQYTYVNIPSGFTVTFIPNANNTPVYWLVQSNVVINGMIDVSGQRAANEIGGGAGPGGWAGGSGGNNPQSGQGPGGGIAPGGSGSFATQGVSGTPGTAYGNSFLLPLFGGSGGAGDACTGGSGGGGAILIAASNSITINGTVDAQGGDANHVQSCSIGSGGSGGAIRLISTTLTGTGTISARGGTSDSTLIPFGGSGRIRIDSLQYAFGGVLEGTFTQGFQPIIFPVPGQGAQLTVTSVGGVPVSASPTGQIVTPDAVLSAQQNNPLPVVVSCANLPLGTQITVSVKPVNGSAVSATGYNNTGTLASSTATISIVIPRGGGLIYATAATGN